MADLDYAEVRGRLAVTVGDTDVDPDTNPDVQWCDSGTVRFTPNLTSVHVIDPVEGVFTAGNAPIEASIGTDGRLTYGGLPFVMLLDLGSDKVNPKIPRNISSYKVDFLDIQSQGRSVSFASFSFHPLPGEVNDLTLLAPLPTGSGTAIVQGPQGIQGIQGEVGPQGPQGVQGVKGDTGDQGIQGIQGDQGIQGPQGIQGIQGETGDIGPQGIQGETGPIGPVGVDLKGDWDSGTDYVRLDGVSYDGASWYASVDPPVGEVPSEASAYWHYLSQRGEQGIQGIQGIQGVIGPEGPQGIQGIQGIKGDTGDTGPQGPQGDPGTGNVNTVNGDPGPNVVLDAADVGAVPAGSAVLLTGDQVVAGSKTFSSAPIVALGPNTFKFSGGPSLNTPTFSFGNSAGKSVALLGGSLGVGITFDDSGSFYITKETKANIDAGTSTGGTPVVTLTAAGNLSTIGTITAAGTGFSGPGSNITGLNASNLGSGTVPDARLPARLGAVAKLITDWDTATESGFYWSTNTAANNPAGAYVQGEVVASSATECTVTVTAYGSATADDSKTWRRSKAGGVWGAWYKLSIAQGEQDARYAMLTGVQTIAGAKTFSDQVVFTAAGSGGVKIQSISPTIRFEDTDNSGAGKNYWWHNNAGQFYLLQDRTGSGTWESTHPILVSPTGNVNFGISASSAGTITAGGTGFIGPGAGITGVVHTTGTETVGGSKTFTATSRFDWGGTALELGPGAQDHTYMGFYARTATPSVRSGYLGYPAAGATSLILRNDLAGANLSISTNGGSVDVTGKMNVSEWLNLSQGTTKAVALGSNAEDWVITQDHLHTGGTNTFYHRNWMRRRASGADWVTADIVDGISIDTSYGTPNSSRAWWRRNANAGLQEWGDAGVLTFGLNASSLTSFKFHYFGAGIAEKQAVASGTSGTVTLDAGAASLYTLTPTGNVTTLTIAGSAASGNVMTLTLVVSQGATPYTIATPSGGVFIGAATPTQVANKKCVFTYITYDGGASWLCSAAVQV